MSVRSWRRQETEMSLHAFSSSLLFGGNWSASRLCRHTAGETTLSTHWIDFCCCCVSDLLGMLWKTNKYLGSAGIEIWLLNLPARGIMTPSTEMRLFIILNAFFLKWVCRNRISGQQGNFETGNKTNKQTNKNYNRKSIRRGLEWKTGEKN